MHEHIPGSIWRLDGQKTEPNHGNKTFGTKHIILETKQNISKSNIEPRFEIEPPWFDLI
jgi:hypothetical protein